MNLLLISNFLSGANGQKGVSLELSEKLTSSGWHVITTSSQNKRINRLIDMIITIIKNRQYYDIANIDVFSGLSFTWAEVSSNVLKLLKKPFIITLHGGNLPGFAQIWPKRVHNLLSIANLVKTPSYYLQKELQSFRGDIRYLPNGLEIERYPYKLRFEPNPKLCWLRSFHEIYNPIMAVNVVAEILEYYPETHLTMIGPNQADGSLELVEKMLNEKELSPYVEITGPVPKSDVPLWLQKSDIFINTTHYESFGVAVMEAAALGLPIVTTNVGELPYLWTDGEDALLVPSDDAGAMAGAIIRLLSEPGLAERLSSNARTKSEDYDWSAIVPQWENMIEEVLMASRSDHLR